MRNLKTIGDAERGLRDLDDSVRGLREDDVIIEFPRRLMLRDAAGRYWRISIDPMGLLEATDMGTTL